MTTTLANKEDAPQALYYKCEGCGFEVKYPALGCEDCGGRRCQECCPGRAKVKDDSSPSFTFIGA